MAAAAGACGGVMGALMVGIQNGTPTLEDSLTASYKTKHVLTI